MFVPPINLGQFQPSPATLADWIYQIWNYLQNNPIATQEQLQEYIATFITTSPETQALIGEGVEQYLTDNPPQAPVQSVQGKTGAVTLAFNDILKNNNTAPVYRAASMPSQSTLQAQYNLGYRLFVNTSTQEIYSITNTGSTTLVGKGKFDGTTIDLDTAQGDTTIAEAVTENADNIDALTTTVSGLSERATAQITGSQYTFTNNSIIRVGNVVTVSFRFTKSANANYATIGTIPVGFRPSEVMTIRAVSNEASGCPVIIQPDGQVITTTAASTYGDIRVVITYVI